jgi:hypothetical protein
LLHAQQDALTQYKDPHHNVLCGACKQVEQRQLTDEMENKAENAQEERMKFQQQEVAYLHAIDALRKKMKNQSEHYEVSQNGLSLAETRIITSCEESKILCSALTFLHKMFSWLPISGHDIKT